MIYVDVEQEIKGCICVIIQEGGTENSRLMPI
jgi:hypothetical protein